MFTFVANLIVYSIKKFHETYRCSSSIAYHKKRTDCILRKLTSNDKNPLYLPIISTLHFFEGQSDQAVTQWVIKLLGISQTSRMKNIKWQVFPNACLLSIFLLDKTSHKFWDQSPSTHYQCCLQVSETGSWHKLRCFYSSNMLQHWIRGRDLICFCKVDHSRISINFSRNWLGLNNLCEIL